MNQLTQSWAAHDRKEQRREKAERNRQLEEETRMHEERMQEHQTELAVMRAEHTPEGATDVQLKTAEAAKGFVSAKVSHERRIGESLERGDLDEARRLQAQLENALTVRANMKAEGNRRLATKLQALTDQMKELACDMEKSTRKMAESRKLAREHAEREDDRRHQAEMRRLERERAQAGLEAEKLAAAELRRMEDRA